MVAVTQQFLNILIGKAGLFNTVPFVGQPLAAVLRQLENVLDVSEALKEDLSLAPLHISWPNSS